jgi:2,4-dienoyl-CoA reductase-like NADH-dependent reductase (Old Yellow Enzyme family)
MSKLFSPLKIKEIELKNRIAVSPMCQYSSVDGFANDWHLVHQGSRAIGGAALIMTEATAVSAEGRITASDLGIYNDDHIVNLNRITRFLEQHDTVAGIQLAHAGRKASCARPWDGAKQISKRDGGWTPVAPSPIPYHHEEDTPVELDQAGINKVISDFKSAAGRACKAGYKVIEIHAAHGYLIDEFLSPLSNHRTDNYGGNFDNRIHLLLEIIKAVKTEWPLDLPVFVRISATDWVEGGWTADDSVRLTTILKTAGVDLIDCSSGGLVPGASVPVGPGYNVPFAEQIRKETGILTGAVGFITDAQQAEEIISKNQADLILIARQSLRDPYFALHSAHSLGEDINWPTQYLRAKV